MTTESPTTTRGGAVWGPPGLVRASALSGLACVGLGLLVAGIALAVSGGAAALGALIGAALAGGVFVLGALAVQVVSWLHPPSSLLVALLTYVCQVMAALMVFATLGRGALVAHGTVSAPWVGATLAACALMWGAVHIRVAMTARVPLYDLPEAGAR